MATIAGLAIDLIARTSNFTRPLSSATAHVDRFSQKARASLNAVQKASERVEKSLKSVSDVGKKAGIALAGAAGLATGLVKLASDAEETANKMGEVFGSMTQDIDRWAVDTAAAYGRSRQQMRTYVTDMQAIMAPLLGNRSVAAEMSKTLSALAVDMGSFFNTDDADAWQALVSGLTGETEPMRRYGVLLTETALEQFRLAEGIDKSVRNMSEAEKVQLRYQLILQRLSTAQGDAVRNADGFANMWRAMTGEFQNAGEELGNRLLPAATQLVTWVRDAVRHFNSLDAQTKNNVVMLGAVTAAVLGFIAALGLLAAGAALAVKAVGVIAGIFGILTSPIAMAIGLVGVFLVAWNNNWFGMRDTVTDIWDKYLKDIFESIGDFLGKAWSWSIEVAGKAWDWLTETTWAEKIEDVKGWLSVAWTWTIDTAGTAWDWLTETSWADKVEDVKGWLSTAWTWTVDMAGKAWSWLDENAPWLTKTLTSLWDLVGSAWTWTVNLSAAAWDWLEEKAPWLTTTLETIWGWVQEAWSWTVDVAGDAWDWLTGTTFEDKWTALKALVADGWSWVINKVGDAWDWLDGQIPDSIRDLGTATLTAFVTFSGETYEAIKHGFETGDWSDAIGIGADVWRTGVKIAVVLGLAASTASAIISAIQTGLGVVTTGLASLGVPGAIGAISIVVSLAEATATGDYKKFGADMVAALAAGIGIGLFTGSPYAGALAFTVVLNFEIGSWIGDQLDALGSTIANQINRGPFTMSQPSGDEIARNMGFPDLSEEAAEAAQAIDQVTESTKSLIRTAILLSGSRSSVPAGLMEIIAQQESSMRDLLSSGGPMQLRPIALRDLEGMGLGAGLWLDPETGQVTGSREALVQGAFDFADLLISRMRRQDDQVRAQMEELGINAAQAFSIAWVTGLEGFLRLPSLDAVITTIDGQAQTAGERLAQMARAMEALGVTSVPSIPGFAGGGYTGNVPVDQIAGVVHGQEIVVPAPAVRKGLAGILEFLGVPGFQDGLMQPIPGLDAQTQAGLTGAQSFINNMAARLNGVVDLMDNGVEALLGLLETTLLESARNILPEDQFKALEERTLSLTRTVRDGWATFKGLFQSTEELNDATDKAAQAMQDAKDAAERQAAIGNLMTTLLRRMPVIMAAMQGAEMGAVFGPGGAVVGALIAVAAESESISAAFSMLNSMLTAGANALGMLLDPILPLVYVLQAVLVPVFTVLGTILQSVLMPIMPFVFEGLKLLGIAVLFVAEVLQQARGFILSAIGGLVEGLGRAIDALPFVSAKGMIEAGLSMQRSARAAADSAAELADARRDLIDLTYQEALERARNTEELERATQALVNVPIGAKVLNRLRWEAATPQANVGAGGVAAMQSVSAGSSVGNGDTYVHIEHMEVQDGEDFQRWLQRQRRHENLIITGTTSAPRRV